MTFNPETHALVPLEPTEKMLEAGCKALYSPAALFDDSIYAPEMAAWRAMVAARPESCR